MTKRRRSEDDAVQPPIAKRQRSGTKIRLFDLSDELLLRILSYLQIESVTRCERACRKLSALCRDNEIWREKYYNQFVRHRARRIPQLTATVAGSSTLRASSRPTRWLERAHLTTTGSTTDWKHAFKVKYNWRQGRARTSEMKLACGSTVLVKVCRGCLYTADKEQGLRIWKSGKVVYGHELAGFSAPSALAVETEKGITRVAVGFEDGAVSQYCLSHAEQDLVLKSQSAVKPVADSVCITAIALAWPYCLSMNKANSLALYEQDQEGSIWKSLANLHCETDLSPASLSLRKTSSTLIAGIAYAFDRFSTGWCLGLQEIRMDLTGSILRNRTTTSVSTPLQDTLKKPEFTSRSGTTSPFSLHPQLMRAPNSLSYSGCYILAGLPDNTLMVYTVTSTADKLEINVGRRLWGHTSAVSAAEVTSTGKAVSISAKSDEMRYWELEDLLTGHSQQKTSTTILPLQKLNNAIHKRGDGLGLALKEVKHETELIRRGISFDDEQAVVIGQRGQGHFISCFDFA